MFPMLEMCMYGVLMVFIAFLGNYSSAFVKTGTEESLAVAAVCLSTRLVFDDGVKVKRDHLVVLIQTEQTLMHQVMWFVLNEVFNVSEHVSLLKCTAE